MEFERETWPVFGAWNCQESEGRVRMQVEQTRLPRLRIKTGKGKGRDDTKRCSKTLQNSPEKDNFPHDSFRN